MANDPGRGVGLLIARFCLAALFWYAGLGAIQSTAATAADLARMGYPVPTVMAWVAAVAQLGGAASLTLGFLTPLGCIALILFLLPTTYSFHLPGALAHDSREVIATGKNLAIIGGLVALLFTGPGRFSLDARVMKGNDK